MEIQEIRRNNLRSLVEQEKSLAEFGRKHGLDAVYLGQILNTDNTGRNMGERYARKMEQHLGLPQGYMDRTDNPAVPPIPRERAFLRQVEHEVMRRTVPDHVKETILYLLRSAPETESTD